MCHLLLFWFSRIHSVIYYFCGSEHECTPVKQLVPHYIDPFEYETEIKMYTVCNELQMGGVSWVSLHLCTVWIASIKKDDSGRTVIVWQFSSQGFDIAWLTTKLTSVFLLCCSILERLILLYYPKMRTPGHSNLHQNRNQDSLPHLQSKWTWLWTFCMPAC